VIFYSDVSTTLEMTEERLYCPFDKLRVTRFWLKIHLSSIALLSAST